MPTATSLCSQLLFDTLAQPVALLFKWDLLVLLEAIQTVKVFSSENEMFNQTSTI